MDKSLALYLHIPFCISKCAYCDFFSRAGNGLVSEDYVRALCDEIRERGKNHPADSWKSIYIGGGTPSLLKKNQIKKILDTAGQVKKIRGETEITVELNPDDVSEDLLKALEECGVNRISLGIQSLNQKSLDFAKRRAGAGQNVSAMERVSKVWKGRFSIDLICGLPFESEESFFAGLEKIFTYNPDHISLYSLTFEDETPFGKLLNQKQLDYDFDFSDSLWLKGREVLEKNGYFQYEVSNFCKKGFESLHNLTYWNHQSYIGAGAGASGSLYYDDGSAVRWTDSRDTDFYISESRNPEKISEIEKIDIKTSEFEFFMMGLRKISGVREGDFKGIFGKNFPSAVKNLAGEWEKKGLCHITLDKDENFNFTLGKEGILYLNNFLIALEGEL